MPCVKNMAAFVFIFLVPYVKKYGSFCAYIPRPPPKDFYLWNWILCQNSLPRELKIRFLGLVLSLEVIHS